MIEGLIRHDTAMRVEKNFVDPYGQSEVAFAFCHRLGGVRLMPRLKRLKYERLYLPDTGMAGTFPKPCWRAQPADSLRPHGPTV
jgi:TnpA family transposase